MSGTVRSGPRPGSVRVSAFIVWLIAFYDIVVAVWLIGLALRDDLPEFWDSAIPDSYLWIQALLSGLLGAIYIWLGQQLMAGDASARVTTMLLAGINIVFALFHFPYGLVGLFFNLVLLGLLNQGQVRRWFGEA